MTASRVAEFDSQVNRLIGAPPAPVGGVTSWNGQTGAVVGTWADIYAFGVGDDPLVDNTLVMPNGNLVFRSTPSGGAFTIGAMAFFENPAGETVDGRVGTFINRRTQLPGHQGTNFGPMDIVYNAGYVGNLIDGTQWGAQLGFMTNSTDETHQVGDQFWQQIYYGANFFFNAPLQRPTPGGGQSASVVYLLDNLYAVFNSGAAVRQARQLSGFGQEVVYPRGQLNGVTPGFISCWTGADIAGPYLAGDGTGIWLAFGDPSHLNDDSPRGIFEAHMLQGDPGLDWGVGVWAWEPGGGPFQMAEFDTFVGMQLFRGGVQLPNVDTTTAPVGGAQSAKLVWDDALQKVRISVDGTAYVDLSVFS